MGRRAESLVKDVEGEILAWLEGGVVLAPRRDGEGELIFPGVAVRGRDDLREVGRNPLQLVWAMDDAFVRYVVHCCARYHDIVSFSKYPSFHLTPSIVLALHPPVFLAKSLTKTKHHLDD